MKTGQKFLRDLKRSEYCGLVRSEHINKEVTIMGWVDSRRDHGGLVFIDIRDREGVLQVVLDPNQSEMSTSKDLRNEYVVAIRGVVKARPDGMQNKKIATGEVELIASCCEILSVAQTPPFQINDQNVSETLRLKYRYLDIRSQRLHSHLKLRHQIVKSVRDFFSTEKFYEIETPILYKSTPEGARDYLVPSRVNQGQFYALPQSPQTLKQLLMIGGIDRYFQIARCFRDEDLRADRQPEFSQIDVEMSFVDQDDLMAMNERLARKIWKEFRGVEIGEIPRMSFHEAMSRFGNDKPDLRFGLELCDLKDLATGTQFQAFNDVLAKDGAIKGLGVPQGTDFSRSFLDKLTDMAKKAGAKGLVWIKADASGKLNTPIAKFMSEDQLKKIFARLCPDGKGVGFIVADQFEVACGALAVVRLHLGHELKLIDTTKDKFLWVVDFPLLEYIPDAGRWMARHHPFTSPQDDAMDALLNNKEDQYSTMLAKAYDLVCNGNEIAGGSIRIHRSDVQDAMFKTLGFSPEEAKRQFGFFIEALQYGTPPHGGIAWGIDRLTMILANTDAIRDVIAFPKTAKATDLMAEAPSIVSRDQLIELGIRLAAQVENQQNT